MGIFQITKTFMFLSFLEMNRPFGRELNDYIKTPVLTMQNNPVTFPRQALKVNLKFGQSSALSIVPYFF